MRSMNARVHLKDDARTCHHHNSVKMTFEQGWILLEDNYGEVVVYPHSAVSQVVLKPSSYDRGS